MLPLYLIDGFNFLHAVVLKGKDRSGWWSPPQQRRVIDWVLASRAGELPLEAWIVFDRRGGAPGDSSVTEPPEGGGVRIFHAPDADEFIVARAAELAGSREVIVVSADRSLLDRAKHRGAQGLSPWGFARYAGRATGEAMSGWPRRATIERAMNETPREERFVRLEEKAAYLEKLALDLNEVIIKQGRLLDELNVRLDRIERQLPAVPEEGEGGATEVPPHY